MSALSRQPNHCCSIAKSESILLTSVVVLITTTLLMRPEGGRASDQSNKQASQADRITDTAGAYIKLLALGCRLAQYSILCVVGVDAQWRGAGDGAL